MRSQLSGSRIVIYKRRSSPNTDTAPETPSDDTESRDLVGGLDEVGMGCIAGPMLVVVTAFPENMDPIPGVTDSKKLSKKQRETLLPLILDRAAYVGMGWCHPLEIDQRRIGPCWQTAADRALKETPWLRHLYVDGIRPPKNYGGHYSTEKKGDARIWQVGAASIVAKVARDVDMTGMSRHWPSYGWDRNSGYGTAEHWEKLKEVGPCPYHRMTFLKKKLE